MYQALISNKLSRLQSSLDDTQFVLLLSSPKKRACSFVAPNRLPSSRFLGRLLVRLVLVDPTDRYLKGVTPVYPIIYAHGCLPARPFKRRKIATLSPLSIFLQTLLPLGSYTEPITTRFIDYNPNRLHQEREVKSDGRGVRLRIMPPKAKIMLQLTCPKCIARATGCGDL